MESVLFWPYRYVIAVADQRGVFKVSEEVSSAVPVLSL